MSPQIKLNIFVTYYGTSSLYHKSNTYQLVFLIIFTQHGIIAKKTTYSVKITILYSKLNTIMKLKP